MEKVSHLFEKFVSFENQYNGYLLARRNKRFKDEVLSYTANLEENLINGINHLIWHDYEITGVHEFYEYFPKKRLITAWPFRNRVINCAAYLVLWPIYSKSFYEYSFGSIPCRGTIKAVQTVQEWIRRADSSGIRTWYIGKADVAKFFFRVPHEVQLRELGKPIDDPEMMWFLETCIRGDGRPTGLPLEFSDVSEAERIYGIGMPVGSLISQMTANVVMNSLDHYMKRDIRVPYYARYMDDMIILCPSKQQCWDALGYMDDYLQEHLGLQLNQKTAVMPYDAGVEFVGRVIRPDRIDIRKATSLRIKNHLRYVREHYATGELSVRYALDVIQSYLGLLSHTSCTALRESLLDSFVLIRSDTPEPDHDILISDYHF